MDCQQFSLCIMNAKVLVHTGVLNRPAVVPGSLIIPTTAGGAQHYQKKREKKKENPPKPQSAPVALYLMMFLLSISASSFWTVEYTSGTCSVTWHCCPIYPSTVLETGITLSAFSSKFLQWLLVLHPHWLSRSLNNLFTQYCFLTIRSHKSKQKHCKISHSWNQLLFFFFNEKEYTQEVPGSHNCSFNKGW